MPQDQRAQRRSTILFFLAAARFAFSSNAGDAFQEAEAFLKEAEARGIKVEELAGE